MTAASQRVFGLPRSQRLQQGREFSRLRTSGRRLVCGCLILNWLALTGSNPSRLGVVTSRKIGNAVVRNRSRRLLREVFRRHQHDLANPIDAVLVARNSIAGRTCAEVERDYLHALRQAKLLKVNP